MMTKFVIWSALVGVAFGAEPVTVDAVRDAEKAWANATVKADEPALMKMLAPQLHYTHSTAEIDTRATFIGNMKSGVRKYTKLEHEAMEVKLYGKVAVVTATAQVATSTNGAAPAPAHLRFIHVWVHEQGRWQMTNHQSLRLAK